jgi:hypothetical protein
MRTHVRSLCPPVHQSLPHNQKSKHTLDAGDKKQDKSLHLFPEICVGQQPAWSGTWIASTSHVRAPAMFLLLLLANKNKTTNMTTSDILPTLNFVELGQLQQMLKQKDRQEDVRVTTTCSVWLSFSTQAG